MFSYFTKLINFIVGVKDTKPAAAGSMVEQTPSVVIPAVISAPVDPFYHPTHMPVVTENTIQNPSTTAPAKSAKKVNERKTRVTSAVKKVIKSSPVVKSKAPRKSKKA